MRKIVFFDFNLRRRGLVLALCLLKTGRARKKLHAQFRNRLALAAARPDYFVTSLGYITWRLKNRSATAIAAR